ncbi:hypothetical protein ACEZCY_35965 [Streptacidiphilus sp. N1-12]|uniref:Uncharacterized protein n=1 Tax=Streptacidiphilus alkalitolerans TaxID=3342712 RepID=A0ABV6WRA3_9ACTN
MQHATSNTETTTTPEPDDPEGPDAYWHGAMQRVGAAQQAAADARAAQDLLAGAA